MRSRAPFFFSIVALGAAACSSSTNDSGSAGGSGGPTTGSAGASAGSPAITAGSTSGGGSSGGAASSSAGSAGSNTTSGGASGSPAGGSPAGGGAGGSSGAGTAGASGVGGSPPSALGPAGGACPAGVVFGSPFPQTTTATLVKGGFPNELEGPVWVESQKALYFCEGGATPTSGSIQKYTPADNKFTPFVTNVGVGGLAMDPQGMIVAASYDKRTLTRFDPATGQRSDVPGGSMYMGQPFDEVNDVVVRSDGNMYFSDPNYATPAGTMQMAFYRLSPPPQSMVTRITIAKNSNGIALSPDGAWLYLSTTDGGPAMQRFAVNADGSVAANGTTWTDPTSDGMAVDCAGNLYLSDAGQTNLIRVISPTDQPLGTISGLGGGYVTNSAFGGTDHKTLYITTSEAVYKIDLNVPGFPN
jgi:gluconolactonase